MQMHFFESMRRYSQNTRAHRPAQAPLPPSPDPITRQPRLTPSSSQSSIRSLARSPRIPDEHSAIVLSESSSQRLTYAHNPDMYTHNVLNSFSFGAASSAPFPYRSIDPLSPAHDNDSDEYLHKADTTPRPSLVATSSLPVSSPKRIRRPSDASTHTFGSSSVSSVSSAPMGSPLGSRRGGSTTTPHTSANTLASEDEHRHPIPLFRQPVSYASSIYTDDDDEFDSDLDRDYEPDIDISSVIQGDPDRGHYPETCGSPSQESFHSSFIPRRGSLAVPIPIEARDREDSIATLRRPSRSLDGLRFDSRVESGSIPHSDNSLLPPAPTSVPESETDWRDLRRRSIQKEKTTAVHNSALDGFDASWNLDPTAGIVNIEWDQSELADIVGGIQGPRSADRSFRRGSSSTTASGRRSSTTSTNSDPFTSGLNKWGGQQYQDEKARWTFTRDKAENMAEQRANLERERHGITNILHHGSSVSSFAGSSSGGFHEHGSFYKDAKLPSVKETLKVKDTQPWKGMAIDAEEWWSFHSNGRYKVVRKSQKNTEAGKPPQQRLNISHHRSPYPFKRDPCDGPSTTIHKHSKAVGFSISRHYRTRVPPWSVGSRTSPSPRITSPTHTATDDKRSTNMILLAPRRVQEAFTSTTTTRMLESHGLLSENGRHSPRDLERLERERKEKKKREMEKEKQRQKEAKKEGKKSRLRNGFTGERSPESSGGSVAEDKKPGPSNAGPSSSGCPYTDLFGVSQSTISSVRPVIRRGHNNNNSGDEDDFNVNDDDDDDPDFYNYKRRQHSRTPHNEAFASMPIEDIDFLEKQGSQQHGLLSSLKGLNLKNKHSALSRRYDSPFDPPWPVASHRHMDRRGIVEDLNISFQDVGLLPAVGEARGSGVPVKRRRQQHPSDSKSHSKSSNKRESPTNVFHSFSAEYLYMLLPLWPGETDPVSEKKSPHPIPVIPIESRKYLLIYYKPDDVSNNKNKNDADTKSKDGKKQQRTSPTSSRDSRDSAKSQADKPILYEKFHFCARIVSYTDIQGSGIRSPDVGLSVIGPLAEACETMPTQSYIDTFQVIGVCSSREKGIEFVPEGLEKLGLTCRVTEDAEAVVEVETQKRFSITGVEEADESAGTVLLLTPIGRAVVEMAWLGSMALTSYGA